MSGFGGRECDRFGAFQQIIGGNKSYKINMHRGQFKLGYTFALRDILITSMVRVPKRIRRFAGRTNARRVSMVDLAQLGGNYCLVPPICQT